MISENHIPAAVLERLTKKSVRSFWMDGLWDLVISGMLVIIAIWGMVYVRFLAFPRWTWPFFQNAERNAVWIGLLILVAGLALYIWLMWNLVRLIKKNILSPYMGYAEHRFFMPVAPKVYAWYAVIYLAGLGILSGLYAWLTGGIHLMSVPFMISPAAILIGIGWYYELKRYTWMAVIGLILAVVLEFIATTQASYQVGPRSFLDIIPQWGSPALPCLVWAALFLIGGVLGLTGVWRQAHESESFA